MESLYRQWDDVGIDYGTRERILRAIREAAERQTPSSERRTAVLTRYPSTLIRWLERLSSLVPSKGVILKSTTGLHTFGAGLPDEEVHYLYGITNPDSSVPAST